MSTVTGLTAARMLEIEAASVVDGDVVGDDLFLTKQDGTLINAGNVRGARGADGPTGHPLAVITAQQLLDVGSVGQIRAGRQLSPTDFTNMGLNVPYGLWNLSSVADSSGSTRDLTNKGSVPFGSGINGVTNTAAVFVGSASQALYRVDSGTNEPFRIKTGSWGVWFRAAKRGTQTIVLSKLSAAAGNYAWEAYISPANFFGGVVSLDGTAVVAVPGVTDVVDDRWHFGVVTYDGQRMRVYVDGALDIAPAVVGSGGPIFSGNAPVNIGGRAGDASTTATLPHFGRIDEAFVTPDVLSDEEVRNLYCASIPHALGSAPMMINLQTRRRRRGGPPAVADFPAQPVRLYNFTAGSLIDQGSHNLSVAPGGAGGTIVVVAGADGTASGAQSFAGAHNGLAASDAGLPAGLNPRSYGCWIKTSTATGNMWVMSWAAPETTLYIAAGALRSFSAIDNMLGPVISDGQWHHAVVVEDNTAADGIKRKLYLDGKVVAVSTVMNSNALQGANRFRIGSYSDGTLPFTGQIDGAFVYAGVLTYEQVRKLYDVGAQLLAPNPKNAGDCIRAIESARLLATFDTIETSDLVNVSVM